ncbi:hypothetical protein ACLB2K_045534 [Fragaria x ananassa]
MISSEVEEVLSGSIIWVWLDDCKLRRRRRGEGFDDELGLASSDFSGEVVKLFGYLSMILEVVCSINMLLGSSPSIPTPPAKMRKRTMYGWGVAILCFVVLMIVTPAIPQSQAYHDFADQRHFFGLVLFSGIPNTLNVISNFPFLVIGLIGLILCYYGNYMKLSLQGELWGWTCFYIGVAAVGIGSSYYHLNPNDATLVWDRLPMTIAFTSIIAIFIIERIDEQKGTISIIPLLLAGVISILYWRFFDDLRPYALVQFLPCIAIPLMAILLPPMYTHSTYWLWAAVFYLLAKVEEAGDKVIYKWTNHIVSGHTLKHLCAAMVPVFLTLMLAKRTIETERQSLLKIWKVSWTEYRKKDDDTVVATYTYATVPVVESQ